jgi:MBG domain (YGX type)
VGAISATPGTYTITPTLGNLSAANYDFTPFNNGTLTINKAHLTVKADDKMKTYDGAPFSPFTATISGFVNSETLATSGVTGSAGFTGSAVGAISATPGTYTITPTLGNLSAANYDFTPFNNGTLTISKANANITVNGYSNFYDGSYHGATGSATGVESPTPANLTGLLSLGATFKNVSGGTAFWSFAGNVNYNPASGSVSIVINKKHLTVTADDKSRTYGAANPPFTATITGFVPGETLATSGVTGSPTFSGNGPSSTNTTPVGDYVITPAQNTLSAANYDFMPFVNGTLHITKATLTVTADNKTVQYSDPLPAFTVQYAGFVNGEGPGVLGGTLMFATNPAFNQFSAPGTTYAIIPSGLTSSNYAFNYVNGTLTVTQEDARSTYTGAMFVSTATPGATTATVTLRATIQDITAVPSDTAYDPYPGVITNATVTFVNRDNNNAVIAANLPVTLIGSDTKTGTASFNWTVNLGTASSVQYTVGIIVNGYYTDNSSAENSVVTISQLTPGSINGGGYLVMQSSGGQYPGGVGTKNNYGFNVQNTKTGVKGNINTIIRNNGHTYQVKGNSMTSLSTNLNPSPSCPPGSASTATFTGKANIQDITNPNAPPISIDGNATLQVSMHDYGEPGSCDTIGVTVWAKTGTLWFSSNWTGANTVEQTIGGGNLAVR